VSRIKDLWGRLPESARAVARGTLLAAAGAALTYLSVWVSGHDFGAWTPAVVAFWSVAANGLRKLVAPDPPQGWGGHPPTPPPPAPPDVLPFRRA
jgi:hypothetical protein